MDIGNFDYTEELPKEAKFPKELILNTSMDGLKYVLNKNKYNKSIFEEC